MRKSHDSSREQKDTVSNCCCNSKRKSESAQVSETNSDQDSSTAKYVVRKDERERRDGPGGN